MKPDLQFSDDLRFSLKAMYSRIGCYTIRPKAFPTTHTLKGYQ